MHTSTKAHRNYRSERGLSRLTVIVFSVIISVVGFCAYHIAPFFYYYYDLVNQFESMIRVAEIETNAEIRTKLWDYIKWMEIPCRKEDLKIMRDGNVMRISLRYTEVFAIDWKEKEHILYEFPFHAYAEGKFSKKTRRH